MEMLLFVTDKVKIVFKSILLVIVLTLFNMLLLVCSFMLPTGRMRQHVADSYLLIEAENPYLEWDTYYLSTRVDFWSEYTEYGMAINGDSEGSPFEQAMYMRYIDTEGRPRDVSVKDYARDPEAYFEQSEYPRYWNGVVIFYKVLLLFFNIADIRMLNMILQISLLCFIVYLMVKKDMSEYIFLFLVAIMFINPVTMLLSVKFSSEYIPMLLGIIVILLYGERIDKIKSGWPYYFAAIGSITSFLCMLSFPGITLGIPLIVMIWKMGEKEVIKKAITGTFFWTLAYGITWIMKWIICTLFTDYNLLEDAFERADFYSAGQSENAPLAERIMRNIIIYDQAGYKVLLIVAILFVVTSICFGYKNNAIRMVETKLYDVICGYLIVLFIPFGIFAALGNGYSYEHSYMAHRQLSIAVVAGLCIFRIILSRNSLLFFNRRGQK